MPSATISTRSVQYANYGDQYLTLKVEEISTNAYNNTSTIKWTVTSYPPYASTRYAVGPTNIYINGVHIYIGGGSSNNTWDRTGSSFPSVMGPSSSQSSQTATGTLTVSHNTNGTKIINFSISTLVAYTLEQAGGTAPNISGSLTLTSLDRTSPGASIELNSVGYYEATFTIISDVYANIWQYSLDNGATWLTFSTNVATTIDLTVEDLLPATQYSILARITKYSNGLTGTSSVISFTTSTWSVLNSVNDIQIDAASPTISANITVDPYASSHNLELVKGTTSLITFEDITIVNGACLISLTSSQISILRFYLTEGNFYYTTAKLYTLDSEGYVIGLSSDVLNVKVYVTSEESAPYWQTPGINYIDTNSITIEVTGDSSKIIQNKSLLQVSYNNATAKNGAIITNYTATIGGITIDGGTELSILFGSVSSSGNIEVTITATDNRGFTATQSTTIVVYAYSNIKFSTSSTLRRENNTDAICDVNIRGNLSAIIINDVNKNPFQTLSYIYYKTNEAAPTEWTSVSLTSAGNTSFTFVHSPWPDLSLNEEYSYYVVFKAEDKLTYDTITFTIGQGTPLISFRSKKVGINERSPICTLDVGGTIGINGKNILDILLPIGYIFEWSSSGSTVNLSTAENVATYFGIGTWTQITDVMLVGAGTAYTINSTHSSENVESGSSATIPPYKVVYIWQRTA
jgi:hypothetical protein